MKRTRILVLALVLALLLTTGAGATPISTEGGTGNANISFTVAPSFSVTIPTSVTETITLTKSGDEIGSGTVTVSEGMLIPIGKALKVKVHGSHHEDLPESGHGPFRLQNGAEYCQYLVKAGAVSVAYDGVVLEVGAGAITERTQLVEYVLAQDITKSGTYADTLTFTVFTDDPTPVDP